ncbi:MAG: hypothetical protein WC935_08660 [Thermoleophilia bacterium]
MKNQYFGDINDYRKYGILRCLSESGAFSIGVCWMLTPNDGRTDGNLTRYLSAPAKWRHRDPGLFDDLRQCVMLAGQREVGLAPRLELIPGAVYFHSEVPEGRVTRVGYMSRCLEALAPSELLFFDPDNGIEVKSSPYGSKGSRKYIYWRELQAAFQEGHSLLVYQHYPRQDRRAFRGRVSEEIRTRFWPAGLFALSTSSVVYFLIAQPRHQERAREAVASIQDRWTPEVSSLNLLDA